MRGALVALAASLGAIVPGAALAAAPSVGECLTASEASVPAHRDHKLRAERAALLVCASSSCPAEIQKDCQSRFDEVDRKIPTVVFEVNDGAGNDLAAVKVTMDTEVVASGLDGTAIALEPGSHTFTFDAGAVGTVSQTILLHETEKDRRVALTIGAAPARPEPVVLPTPASTRQSGRMATRRIAGLAVGGVGLGGVALGAVFGGLALAGWNDATALCPSHNACSGEATEDRSRAATESALSDVGFIAGGVLAAAGLVLFLTAPTEAKGVGVSVGPSSVSLAGRF